MNLIHTSPQLIASINKNGTFGDGLFFSTSQYSMSSNSINVYHLEMKEDDIIDVTQFFYHDDYEKLNEIVEHVMNCFNVDEEQAQRYIEGRDHGDLECDDSWWMQKLSLDCALILGYQACSMRDEQGTAYLVSMGNRLNDLQLIKCE